MAVASRRTAVLDACVLYPAVVRDALISLHVAGFFTARWSQQIEQEWVTNLLANRPDLDAARLNVTCQRMRRAVPDWEVTGYNALIASLDLPDAGDRHVLAAAIACPADAIVTFNAKDFPAPVVAACDIEVFHPDDFVVLQFELDQREAMKTFKAMRARLKHPPMSPADFISSVGRGGLSRTAARLAENLELL